MSDADTLAALGLHVSRETEDRLRLLEAELQRWSPRINLVAPSTLPVAWRRHVLDSAQLWPLPPAGAARWLDLGSGGGFPGIVIAILAKELQPDMRVTLVESDQRKCVFLAEMARTLDLDVDVKRQRIEAAKVAPAQVISARALAPLDRLLALAAPHLAQGGVMLFPKGGAAADELTRARRCWHMDVREHASRIDPSGVILEIRNVRSTDVRTA